MSLLSSWLGVPIYYFVREAFLVSYFLLLLVICDEKSETVQRLSRGRLQRKTRVCLSRCWSLLEESAVTVTLHCLCSARDTRSTPGIFVTLQEDLHEDVLTAKQLPMWVSLLLLFFTNFFSNFSVAFQDSRLVFMMRDFVSKSLMMFQRAWNVA